MDNHETYRFETGSDVGLYTIPTEEENARWLNWAEYDRGPGIFHLPAALSLGIRAQGLDDTSLKQLVRELLPVAGLRYLHLAENRGITDRGAESLAQLKQLRYLNIGACDLTSQGMAFLTSLPNLTYLNLSYCNRITEKIAPYIQKIPRLEYLDLQGCIKINTGGIKKLEKRGLTIHKP